MKHLQKVKEVVFNEIEGYSWFHGSHIGTDDDDSEIEYYVLSVLVDNKQVRSVRLKSDGQFVWVELGETWHEIEEYSYSMRFLWMAILNWYE